MADKPFALTQLQPDQETSFQAWAKALPWHAEFQQKHGGAPNLDDPQYDYRGAYQAGIVPERYAPDSNAFHWPSALPDGRSLKAPDHPTAWAEQFMQATGKDPIALGIDNPELGARVLKMMTGQ